MATKQQLQDQIERDKKRNAVAVAMRKRYGSTITKMKDRRLRRSKDFKNNWRRDWD